MFINDYLGYVCFSIKSMVTYQKCDQIKESDNEHCRKSELVAIDSIGKRLVDAITNTVDEYLCFKTSIS